MTGSSNSASRTAVSVGSTSTSDLTTLSSDDTVKPTTTANANANAHKKRSRDSGASTLSGKENIKKAKVQHEEGDMENMKEKGVYCHQCRQRCESNAFLRCTKLKQKSKNVNAACNHAFCDNDLVKRYGISPHAVRWEGTTNSVASKDHDPQAEYLFECPCCHGQCQNSLCRKKKGLEPLGDILKAAKAAGLPTAAALLDSKSKVNEATRPKGSKLSFTTVIELSDDSDLSELESEEPKVKTTPAKTAQTTSTPKTAKAKVGTPKAKSKADTPKSVKSKATTPKSVKSSAKEQVKGKGTPAKGTPKISKIEQKTSVKKAVKVTKGAKSTPKKSAQGREEKPKPVKKPEVPVEPPAFEKVDTKLGREEAEQRIMLREYLLRFRPVLSVPERALPPVDDFDRPLTEANVRLFAGAMLDTIREELEHQGGNEDLLGQIRQNREELRYYADLARFAAIYNSLSSSLSLRLPPAIVHDRSQANDAALRALLDLDEDQSTPAWATDLTAGPSRRVGASRIPQATEVIRMLLAFAERTLSTPAVRGDLEYFTPENEARRRHASAVKKETNSWEAKSKKLAEARIQCRSAAETKANKELTNKEHNEHQMRVALQDVNLRAALSKRALRHEAIGVDLDGRVYYALNPRTIEDDGRPPIGWASGLLVWGKGVARKDSSVDDLPLSVDRWSHFGKSKAVKELIKWVEWRQKKALAAAKASSSKSPAKTKGTPSKATPSKNNATPKQRTLLEVILPTTKRGPDNPSSDDRPRLNGRSDDASSTSSGLSPPPSANREELLSHLAPKDYTPSKDSIDEQGKEFVRRLREVAEWLEVLEWKGMGELE